MSPVSVLMARFCDVILLSSLDAFLAFFRACSLYWFRAFGQETHSLTLECPSARIYLFPLLCFRRELLLHRVVLGQNDTHVDVARGGGQAGCC